MSVDTAPAENAAIAQVAAMFHAWHARLEKAAILASKLGLTIDDGVIFTRAHETAPTGQRIPTGWRLITASGERRINNPKFARIEDADTALDALIKMIDSAQKNPSTLSTLRTR